MHQEYIQGISKISFSITNIFLNFIIVKFRAILTLDQSFKYIIIMCIYKIFTHIIISVLVMVNDTLIPYTYGICIRNMEYSLFLIRLVFFKFSQHLYGIQSALSFMANKYIDLFSFKYIYYHMKQMISDLKRIGNLLVCHQMQKFFLHKGVPDTSDESFCWNILQLRSQPITEQY